MAVMLLEWVFTSTFLILVVLALRAALGARMHARLRYALWAVVLLRLLVPVQLFTSPVAGTRVFTEKRTEQNLYAPEVPDLSTAPPGETVSLPAADAAPGAVPALPDPPAAPEVPNPPAAPDLTKAPGWLGWVWLAGSGLAALVLLASNLRFYRRLRRARIPLEGADCSLRVYAAVGLPSPCLFGVIRPAVYVTPEAAVDPAMLRHVLAHEYTHYRQGDHIWSLLRCAALAVHWWNPLVWLAAFLSRRDGELACDEGALKRLGDGERAAYGSTLLALVTAKPGPGDLFRCATTMAGDKKSLKERITRIAQAPRRVVWAVVVAVAVTALACLCAFGQAAEPEEKAGPDGLTWPDGVDEMTFVRDAGGFGGDFTVTLNRDGTFSYYAGLLSSYIGRGTWTEEDGVICLADEELKDSAGVRYYYFTVEDGNLLFRAEGSASFMYVDVKDGERFTRRGTAGDRTDQAETAFQYVEIAFQYTGNNPVSSFAVPADVLAAARGYVAAQFQADVPGGQVTTWGSSYNDKTGAWEPVPLERPVPFDRVRIKSMESPYLYTVQIGGRDVEAEVWRLLFEYHTTDPEYATILLAGGMTLDDEGWMNFYGSGLNYLVFTGTGGNRTATPLWSQSEFMSVGFRNDLLSALQEAGLGSGFRYQNADFLYRDDGDMRMADLNRDGVEEYIQTCDVVDGETVMAKRLEVWEGNELLFSEEGFSAHAGWTALFLCTLDGEDYLLRYRPAMYGGVGTYDYRLFTLENGTETVVRENSVEFDVNFQPWLHQSFDPEAIAAFTDEVNGLLSHSVQLLNTDQNLLDTFEKNGRLYDDLWILNTTEGDFARDPSKSLLDNLKAYQAAMEDLWDNPWDDPWGLCLTTGGVTPTGLTFAFTQSGGAPTGELQYGSKYWLEREENGEWTAVPDILDPSENWGWTDEAYSIPRNSQRTQEVDWT